MVKKFFCVGTDVVSISLTILIDGQCRCALIKITSIIHEWCGTIELN